MKNLSDIQKRILELKKEKNALILAHYYVPLEVQDVADHVCDSYAMATKAMDATEPTVIICGVRFMGESAKLLAPEKKVLIPAIDAGCPMADMVTVEDVLKLKEEHPNAAVMCYVNSSAAVKAVSDICCTSSSAIRVANSIDNDEIIFVPDIHLAEYVADQVPDKKFILHTGFCPTHHRVTEADIIAAKKAHPEAAVAVHPECRKEVLKHADFVGSTAQIIDFARKSEAPEIIIGTEMEIAARLQREMPEKKVYSVTSAFVCPNMKKVTPEALLNCLENEEFEITLDEAEAAAAREALDRMVKC
ncbi:MAG TPA: quinolinate synthase NadA [Papillibacter sp.]|jgi:quinolinate synthase|nr:quinolinate synthase NadA [Papillibacter sp.]